MIKTVVVNRIKYKLVSDDDEQDYRKTKVYRCLSDGSMVYIPRDEEALKALRIKFLGCGEDEDESEESEVED